MLDSLGVVLTPGAIIPERASLGASGYDLRAAIPSPVTINSLERVLVPTGIRVALPEGFEAQVRPRSGLAYKHGVTVLNTPGTIDADYRGDIGVVLVNLSRDPFTVEPGMRVAQLVFQKVEAPQLYELETFASTERGSGGFGSTGTN